MHAYVRRSEMATANAGATDCVTGASSFIGSWFVRPLLDRGYTIHVVIKNPNHTHQLPRRPGQWSTTRRPPADNVRSLDSIHRCHRHGVTHWDLKPENFLFANNKETSPHKAIDFGLSIFFKHGEKLSEIVESPYYMAPEVLKRKYGPEIDIWSAGVILYILLCGVSPFWVETEQGVVQAIL